MICFCLGTRVAVGSKKLSGYYPGTRRVPGYPRQPYTYACIILLRHTVGQLLAYESPPRKYAKYKIMYKHGIARSIARRTGFSRYLRDVRAGGIHQLFGPWFVHICIDRLPTTHGGPVISLRIAASQVTKVTHRLASDYQWVYIYIYIYIYIYPSVYL